LNGAVLGSTFRATAYRSEEQAMSKGDAESLVGEGVEDGPQGIRPGSFAAGLAVGALLGAAVALLFAPAPGHVTRGRARRHLEDAREFAEDEFEDLSKRARRELRRRVG
jgi:hypothetical protein